MNFVNRRVHVVTGLVLVLGLGTFALLMIKTQATLLNAEVAGQPTVPVGPGVKMKIQTDKNIYLAGDTVLVAARNDSRKVIWVMERSDGCTTAWWRVEVLGADGEKWNPVALAKGSCDTPTYGQATFARHTVMNTRWVALVPGAALGNVMTNAPAGTYRVSLPYLAQITRPVESDWASTRLQVVSSPSFTLQENLR